MEMEREKRQTDTRIRRDTSRETTESSRGVGGEQTPESEERRMTGREQISRMRRLLMMDGSRITRSGRAYLELPLLSASALSALFVLLISSMYSTARRSAHTLPPSTMTTICRNTLNCGVRPR